MNEQDLSRNEYGYLLDELKTYSQRIDSIYMLLLGSGIFPFLTVMLSEKIGLVLTGKWYAPLLFAIPFIVILPSINLIATNFNNIVRISAYIQCKYECKETNIGWQTIINRIRKKKEHRYSPKSTYVHYLLLLVMFSSPGIYYLIVMLNSIDGIICKKVITCIVWVDIYIVYCAFIFKMGRSWQVDQFEKIKRSIENEIIRVNNEESRGHCTNACEKSNSNKRDTFKNRVFQAVKDKYEYMIYSFIVCSIVAAFYLTYKDTHNEKIRHVITLKMKNVDQIKKGDKVLYKGNDIGRVSNVSIKDSYIFADCIVKDTMFVSYCSEVKLNKMNDTNSSTILFTIYGESGKKRIFKDCDTVICIQ